MKEAVITLRGREIKFSYQVIDHGGIIYAKTKGENGKKVSFYKGMYGIKDRWENRYCPDDLVDAVSGIFNKETPVKAHVVDHWQVPN